MHDVFIKYNPYKVETFISIDGEPVKPNSSLNFGENHLQEWIEDLPEKLCTECLSKDFKITFQGTVLDYEDVVSVANSPEVKEKRINITCSHIPAKEVKDKEQAIAEIFADIQKGPFDELRQDDVTQAFKIANSSDFPVNVVATMSAGKSTLINALLRKKLMPAKQEACTATITEIKDCDDDNFFAEAYDASEALVEAHPSLTLDDMKSMNDNPNITTIKIRGNIPFVTADDVSLILVDTPGPNNSRTLEHKAATYRMLDKSSKTLVLYILNASQLAVNDDSDLLNHVAESMKVHGRQSKDRFIFVVNKLDNFNAGEDSVESAIEKVKDYLDSKGIKNPNIYPASALTALNIRTVLDGVDLNHFDLNQCSQIEYNTVGYVRNLNGNPELHLENYAPLTPSVRGQINSLLSAAIEQGDKIQEALIHSGIISIEAAIRMYVQKYAKTAKIKGIVDTFAGKLESRKTFERTRKAIAENEDQRNAVLAQIEKINEKIANGESAKAYKAKINNYDYNKVIKETIQRVIFPAQQKIEEQISSSGDKIDKAAAQQAAEQFASFTSSLFANVRVELENTVYKQLQDTCNRQLEEYKNYIASLADECAVGDISLDPLKIISGDIGSMLDYQSLLNESVEDDERWEVVGNHREYHELIGFRRFLNDHLGTNFNVDYDVVDDYDWVTYKVVSMTDFAKKFFAPIQKKLYEYGQSSEKYAKGQVEDIKREFSKRFDQLDAILQKKMNDLAACNASKETLTAALEESSRNLKWLEEIQTRIQAILDI